MWQLYMILFVNAGTASFGGPLIIDGFKTETACVAHMKKIEDATPKVKLLFDTDKYIFASKTCLKVEK